MKKIILSIALLASAGFFFSACEKEEEEVIFDKANVKAGTLAISASSLVFDKADDAKTAVTFTLTKADFGYPAGIDYKLQVGRKGTDFKGANETSLANALEKKFTVKEFNALAINAGALPGSGNDFEARVIASIATGQPTATSNVVSFSVAPYFALLNYPKVYVPGGYQGWDPAKDNVEALASIEFDNENYEGYINLTEAKNEFKITPEPTWAADWGDEAKAGNTGKLKEKGENIIADGAGYYFIKMSVPKLTYSVTKTAWGIIGDATPTGWDKDTDMTYNTANKTWSIKIDLIGGKNIKFRANDDWAINYGDGAKDGSTNPDGFADFDAKDIKIAESGNYTVTLNLSNPGNYTYSIKKN
jgi:starch-binding outer membrane protein SusE/F